MGILRGRQNEHWAYFIALEDDLGELSRYIEFAEPNYPTYSIQIARILLTAGAETDVLLKKLVTLHCPEERPSNIREYHPLVAKHCPRIFEFEVALPHWGMSLIPWEIWKDGTSPRWWRAHNEVKHKRHEEFHQANLFNAIEAVASVFVLNLYCNPGASADGTLKPTPKYHRPGPPNDGGSEFRNGEFGTKYQL